MVLAVEMDMVQLRQQVVFQQAKVIVGVMVMLLTLVIQEQVEVAPRVLEEMHRQHLAAQEETVERACHQVYQERHSLMQLVVLVRPDLAG